MKKKIEDMIMDIEQKMEAMSTQHLYFLKEEYAVYIGQIRILNELLQTIKR